MSKDTTTPSGVDTQPITAIVPAGFTEAKEMAQYMAKSALIAKDLRGKEHDVYFAIATGAELGISPMAALRGIDIVEGKPFFESDLMVALVMKSGLCEYLRPVELTNTRAVYVTKRRGDPEPFRLEFSIEDAQRAGLAGKDVWKKYPRRMLANRCKGELCKTKYEDVLFGCGFREDLPGQEPPAEPAWNAPDNVIDADFTEHVEVASVYDKPASQPDPQARIDAAVGARLAAEEKRSERRAATAKTEKAAPPPAEPAPAEEEKPLPSRMPAPASKPGAGRGKDELLASIAAATARKELDDLVQEAGKLPEPDKSEVRNAWVARNSALAAERQKTDKKGGGR